LIYDVEVLNPNPEQLSSKDIFKMCSKANVVSYQNSDDSSFKISLKDSLSNTKVDKILSHLEKLGC